MTCKDQIAFHEQCMHKTRKYHQYQYIIMTGQIIVFVNIIHIGKDQITLRDL